VLPLETGHVSRDTGWLDEQLFLAVSKFFPDLPDFVVGLFLAELAIALEGHDQANPFRERFEILVKDKTGGRPIVAAIAGVGLLKGRLNPFFSPFPLNAI